MRRTVITLGLFVLGACHHAGAGQGTLESTPSTSGAKQAEGAVAFQWHSGADPSQGTIDARLPDGKSFTGTFLQVTSQSNFDAYGPYYAAWGDPMWGDAWYNGPEAGFVTAYSGKAVAHLTAPDGTKMRCKFDLRQPASGMTGGGEGDCQMSDNESVFDAELPAVH